MVSTSDSGRPAAGDAHRVLRDERCSAGIDRVEGKAQRADEAHVVLAIGVEASAWREEDRQHEGEYRDPAAMHTTAKKAVADERALRGPSLKWCARW
jgi:hypothetical protein